MRHLARHVPFLAASLALASTATAQPTFTTMNGVPGENLSGIYATAHDNVYVSGGFRVLSRYDGTQWVHEPHPAGANRYSLFGLGANEIYSTGQAGYATGNILRWDGASWSTLFTTPATELIATWGTSASNLLTVGDGRAYHYDGAGWSELSTGLSTAFNTDRLEAVWGGAANDAWLGGYHGIMLHWNGSSLQSSPIPTTQSIRAIHGTAGGNAFAVGDGGTILRNAGSGWQAMSSGVGASLHGLWAFANDDVWASGANGTLLHFDGLAWASVATGTTRDLRAIHAFDASALYIAECCGPASVQRVDLRGQTVTPEPATVLLLGSGLLAIAGVARRRRR